MNKKRFEALPNNRGAWDIIDYKESEKINGFVIYNDLGNIYFSSAPQLVDLLNDFYEEILKLEKENEKLKTDIRLHIEDSEKYRKLSLQFDNRNKELISENVLLEKEKEQLKKENMEYYQLVNCRNCKYHNYDWFDDGDEFEVCEKEHNERLMYNQFCKEWEEL